MRTKWATMACGLLLLGLLVATQASAHHPLTVAGSLAITKQDDINSPLDDGALVGFAVIANPGLEKTITQHLPPFTLPVFIDADHLEDGDQAAAPGRSPRPLLRRRFDTTLVLTNPKGTPLEIKITLRDGSGEDFGSTTRTLRRFETQVIPLADVLADLLP